MIIFIFLIGFTCITCTIHLQDTFTDDMLAAVFKAVLEKSKVPPQDIGDVCVGMYFSWMGREV